MRIVYHHRTRATDAQRVHILEVVTAFRKLGHEVEIASLVDTEGQQNVADEAAEAGWKRLARGIPFAYEALQLAYNLVGIPLLLRKALWPRPDFIYERYSLFNFTGVLVAALIRRPLILELNSPFALEQKSDGEIVAMRFANWTERAICNSATRVIVVTNPLKRIMIGLGVKEERLLVMPNGVNLDQMHSTAGSPGLRKELGVMGKVVIGFVGWFKKWHGLEFLLSAFHKSGLGEANAVILLIGDGPAMPDLRAYVNEKRLQDSVIFTGALPHADVSGYLDAIDIAAQPAANEYCCPMKILEYMGRGKPLVAPRQENITELVREGIEAELFTPSDETDLIRALTKLVNDATLRESMGKNARESIDNRGYLWTNNAERVLALVRPHSTVQ